jgi:outer membrane protein assembly factor BamB
VPHFSDEWHDQDDLPMSLAPCADAARRKLRKLGRRAGSVKRHGAVRGGAAAAVALLLAGAASGCGRPLRPAPFANPGTPWAMTQGGPARAPHAAETVADSVELVWRADVGRGLHAPVLVEGGIVFAATGSRMIAALDPATGEHFWDRRLDGGAPSGLVRHGTRLIAATVDRQGRVHATGISRGSGAWSRRVGPVSHAPVLVGDTVLVVTDGGALHVLDAASGSPHWQIRLPAAPRASPVPTRHGHLVMVRDSVLLLDRRNGAILARTAVEGNVSAAPAVAGDTAFLPLFSGELLLLSLPALAELGRVATGAPILAAPVVAPDGAVYFLNRAAELWRLPRPGPAENAERLAGPDGAATGSLTLVANGLLVGRLDGVLLFLDRDGGELWRRELGDAIRAPVTVADGAVYVPLLRGHIVKLR